MATSTVTRYLLKFGRYLPLIALLALLAAFAWSSYSSGIGSLRKPGDGLVPMVAVAVIALGLVAAVVERIRERRDGDEKPVTGKLDDQKDDDQKDIEKRLWTSPRMLVVIVVAIVFVVYATDAGNTPYFGAYAGIGFISFVVMLAMRERLWLALTVGVIVTLVSHLVFGTLLGVTPVGLAA